MVKHLLGWCNANATMLTLLHLEERQRGARQSRYKSKYSKFPTLKKRCH